MSKSSIPFVTAYSQRTRAGMVFSEPSLAKQSFKDECNINNIVKRSRVTGMLSHLSSRQPRFMDLGSSTDFHSAMNTVIAAEKAFSELPSDLRERFSNDPAKLLEFVHDPKNHAEAITLGLVDAPEALEPSSAPVAPQQGKGGPKGSPRPSKADFEASPDGNAD